jgi:hypothetical protein
VDCDAAVIFFLVIAGLTGMCHHTQQLVEMGSGELFFAYAGHKPQYSRSHPHM